MLKHFWYFILILFRESSIGDTPSSKFSMMQSNYRKRVIERPKHSIIAPLCKIVKLTCMFNDFFSLSPNAIICTGSDLIFLLV